MPTICELHIAFKKLGIKGYSGKNKSELEEMLRTQGLKALKERLGKMNKKELKLLKEEMEKKLLKLQNSKSYTGFGDERELVITKQLAEINKLLK
jgi:Fe-S cluster biosynthesis and repair protein YggX